MSRTSRQRALSLTGNALDNTLYADNGANVLAGGAGNDVIYSYGGDDQILFNAALGATNVDRLEDYSAGSDKIPLDNSVFTALADGALPESAFARGRPQRTRTTGSFSTPWTKASITTPTATAPERPYCSPPFQSEG